MFTPKTTQTTGCFLLKLSLVTSKLIQITLTAIASNPQNSSQLFAGLQTILQI